MTTLDKYKEAREKVRKAREEATTICKEAFQEVCNNFFNKFPQVNTISWSQFTPYFNDGDTCYFGVCEPNLNGNDKYGYNYEDEKGGGTLPDEAFEEVDDIFSCFDTEDFEFMFGDHVEVTVTREDITTEECSHD